MSGETKSAKYAKESMTIMTELVLPNDTNMLNNLMGGKMLHWMDIAAAVSAQKHCNSVVVTASVDNVSFKKSIAIGNVVELKSKVTRTFNSSMEVYIEVTAEDMLNSKKYVTHSAFYTMVALDNEGKTIEVPGLIPETDEEKELYEGALRRRQFRLLQVGRITAEEASELKSMFKL